MPPIVLIHGFPLDSSMWAAQVQALRARGWTVLTPDLPGFGESPLPALAAEAASMEGFGEFVRRIIETEAGGRAIVGGFSMGGYIMLALLRAHPECVAGAMFVDTRADADSPEARAARLASIEAVRAGGPAGLIDTLMTRLLGKNPAESVRKELRAIMQRQSHAAIISAQSAMARRRDQTDLLAGLRIPVLVVVGEEDVITPPAAAEAIHTRVPRAELVRIAGCGHMAPMEQPDTVSKAIAGFAAAIH